MMAKLGEIIFRHIANSGIIVVQYGDHYWAFPDVPYAPDPSELWECPDILVCWAIVLHDRPGKDRWEMRVRVSCGAQRPMGVVS